MSKTVKKNNLGVVDFETDPFLRGRMPEPFVGGLLLDYENGEQVSYKVFADFNPNSDYTPELDKLINTMGEFKGYIYAHNGGRFDFLFIIERLLEREIPIKNLKMIKNRIAKLSYRNVTLLDSFLLLPVPLKATGQKDDFEYWKTEKSIETLTEEQLKHFNRDIYNAGVVLYNKIEHKESDTFCIERIRDECCHSPRLFYRKECLVYLKQDCKGALDTIKEFIRLYGFGLTLAGRAFNALKETGYELPTMRATTPSENFGTYKDCDAFFRKFFFGGRVQCFETGHIEGDLYYYDINSAYPYAMTFDHWYGDCELYTEPNNPTEFFNDPKLHRYSNASFYEVHATSEGAFPVRKKDGGIHFPERTGDFNVTGWELRTGLELGIVKDLTIIKAFAPMGVNSMKRFVKDVYKRKSQAEKDKNPIQRLIHKLVMNSGYGRFAIDSSDWKDHYIEYGNGESPLIYEDKGGRTWEMSARFEELGVDFYESPTPDSRLVYHSVCTAASITGFVRAMILKAIANSPRPLYCDTDSIISVGRPNLPKGDKLGEWDCEAKGENVWIAGKKLYAFEEDNGNYKIASKGVRCNAEEIKQISKGQSFTWSNIAPSYSLMTNGLPSTMKERILKEDKDDFRKIFIERTISLKQPLTENNETEKEDNDSIG